MKQDKNDDLVKPHSPLPEEMEAWVRLRGILKDVFAEFGGGEVYLRDERSNFES